MIKAAKANPHQEVQVSSNKPLLCSLPRCVMASREITTTVPYILLNIASGAILFHLKCIGINPNGNLKDPNYVAHTRDVLIDRFIGH